jgi:hypothetical protein
MVSRLLAATAAAGATGSGLVFAPAVLIVLIAAVFAAYLVTVVLAIWFPGVVEVLGVLRGNGSPPLDAVIKPAPRRRAVVTRPRTQQLD